MMCCSLITKYKRNKTFWDMLLCEDNVSQSGCGVLIREVLLVLLVLLLGTKPR